jgi:hypothetical protein
MNAERPRVVCLSGSMRFEEQMRAAAVDLSLEGHIVTGPFVNMKRPDPRWATDELADPIKVALDQLHFRKIDLADEVVVVSDETGYIGDSTRNEIAYAEKHGKPVRHVRVGLPPGEPQVPMEELRERVASVVDDYTAGEDYGSGPARYYLTVDTPDELTAHLAAALFPGLDWLFRAVADWQALWDEKEEWTKAAKEAWQRENVLAWLHAEAVWHHGQTLEDYQRNDEAMLAENQRLADENELLREELDKVSGGWEARVSSRASLVAERAALRAQLAGSVALPEDWQDQIESAVLGMAGTWPTLAVAIQRSVTRLVESWAPVSESVPATPEPPLEVGDRVEFSSLQPEWRDGTVAGINPLRVRADDTDNLTTSPAAVRRLPSGVDRPEVEAALPTFGCLRIDLVPEWKKGDKALYRAHPDDEGEEVEVRDVVGSTALVEADPFPFGNPRRWSADVSELSPAPAVEPRCTEIIPDGYESAMECGADPVPGTERCADHTRIDPSRDSATSEASHSVVIEREWPGVWKAKCSCGEEGSGIEPFIRVWWERHLEATNPSSTPPAAGEADTEVAPSYVVDFEPGLFGPFGSRMAAHAWAENHVREAMHGTGSWIVSPVHPPFEVLPNTEQEAGQ